MTRSDSSVPVVQARPGERIDAPAWALLIAGATGAAAAVFLAVVPAAVADDQFSYPLTAAGFTVIQVFFFVHHLALAWGLYAVWRRGFGGAGPLVRLAGALSVLAMVRADRRGAAGDRRVDGAVRGAGLGAAAPLRRTSAMRCARSERSPT